MSVKSKNPMIVQSDQTILLEVDNPSYEAARDQLVRFAELQKSPEHIHTYRITPLSLWNAAASGLSASEVTETLDRFNKYEVPQNIQAEVVEYISRYGKLKLCRIGDDLALSSTEPDIIKEIWYNKEVRPYLKELADEGTILVKALFRGHLKQALIKFGLPVEDLAGYVIGAPLSLAMRRKTGGGAEFYLRPYQQEAVAVFHAGGGLAGGSGVIVLPCGAGKTIIGMAAIEKLQTQTLILVTSITALRQWKEELLDKTTLSADQIGEYSGEKKEVCPVTIATYNILTYRRNRQEAFPHFDLFDRQNWGMVIYDEVHLLPAPVFRITAEIQARRRLGLTATLVREDGRETDVFSLIGPKKYDVPWKVLEGQGWIAPAECWEIRTELPSQSRIQYAVANLRKKFRVASENPAKDELVIKLVERHRQNQVLIIGQYIAQLETLARRLNVPIITGRVGNWERAQLYGKFRRGEIKLLVVSKVANFAVDLPDANVAIQVSGTFGSRQEEAQRLGRILRPKTDGSTARFYSLVTRNTTEQQFAANRQLFLTEQGYKYFIKNATEFFEPK